MGTGGKLGTALGAGTVAAQLHWSRPRPGGLLRKIAAQARPERVFAVLGPPEPACQTAFLRVICPNRWTSGHPPRIARHASFSSAWTPAWRSDVACRGRRGGWGCRERGADANAKIEYPATRRVGHEDAYFGVRVSDPYRWLEQDIRNSNEVAAWVAAENKATFSYLESIPQRKKIAARLAELWNFEQYGLAEKAGGRYSYLRKDGLQNQPVLYVLDSLDAKPRVLLDPNAWSKDGAVALGQMGFSDDGRWLAYSRSEAGSDWSTGTSWRSSRASSCPMNYGGQSSRWLRGPRTARDFSTAASRSRRRGSEFQSLNFNNKFFYHRLGTAQSADELVYCRPEHPDWQYEGVVSDDGRWLVIKTQQGTDARIRITIKDLSEAGAKPVELIDNFEHEYEFVGNDGPVLYFKTDLDAPRRRLAAIDVRKPAETKWKEIIPESEATLAAVGFVGDRFIASYLKDVQPQVRIFAMEGHFVREVKLPGIGAAAGFHGKRTDADTFYVFSSFTTPPSIYHYDMATGESRLFRRPEAKFNPDDYEVKQVFYHSKDGTRIPMFIAHKKGIVWTAPARRCSMATGDSTSRSRRRFRSVGWHGWRWAAFTPSRTSAAEASTARRGIRRARDSTNRMSLTTSSPPRSG